MPHSTIRTEKRNTLKRRTAAIATHIKHQIEADMNRYF